MAPRPLSWSAPPPEIVKQLIAGQAITFWVEELHMVRANRHAHLVFVPLGVLDVAGGGPGAIGRVLPGATRDQWLVWQPLSGVGTVTSLPVEATRLTADLRLPARDPRSRIYAAAIEELMAAMYAYRAV
ncbi:MAG: hypothetical protein QOJ07_2161 [Thermoleophilaceae bacterium]|jgi:hypothetical protein|nr:hypothetical protein [Thermoleophilaceae bacterium]